MTLTKHWIKTHSSKFVVPKQEKASGKLSKNSMNSSTEHDYFIYSINGF